MCTEIVHAAIPSHDPALDVLHVACLLAVDCCHIKVGKLLKKFSASLCPGFSKVERHEEKQAADCIATIFKGCSVLLRDQVGNAAVSYPVSDCHQPNYS